MSEMRYQYHDLMMELMLGTAGPAADYLIHGCLKMLIQLKSILIGVIFMESQHFPEMFLKCPR